MMTLSSPKAPTSRDDHVSTYGPVSINSPSNMDAGIFNLFNRNREFSETPQIKKKDFKAMQTQPLPLYALKKLAENEVVNQM